MKKSLGSQIVQRTRPSDVRQRRAQLSHYGTADFEARFFARIADCAVIQRLACDCPEEKDVIAQYVAERLIDDGFRSFVQGSSISIPLGFAIAERDLGGCVFQTNSVVFPLAALRDECVHQVHMLSAPIFDDACGAMLFPANDPRGEQTIRALFHFGDEPLNSAILAPLAVTADGGLYYRRPETAWLAGILLEEAERVLVLVPGNRVFRSGTQFRSHYAATDHWQELRVKAHLVVAGVPSLGGTKKLSSEFEIRGIRVDWYDASTGLWDPGEPTAKSDAVANEVSPASGEFVTDWATLIRSPRQFLRSIIEPVSEVIASGGTEQISADEAEQLLKGISQIRVFLEAFRERSKIGGPRGVAAKLGLSRNAIYVQIDKLGLDVTDFGNPEANLPRLLLRSKFRSIVESFLGAKPERENANVT